MHPCGRMCQGLGPRVKDRPKISFIILWRLNDWGFYKRRHEALARELSSREEVERVVHVEYVSFKGLLYQVFLWFKERDRSLRKVYGEHIKKGISLKPAAADKSGKLFIYSVVLFYTGKNSLLISLNESILRLQYEAVNKSFKHSKSRKVLLLYPPSEYFPDVMHNISHDILIADLVDDDISRAADESEKSRLRENYKEILPNCRWIFSTSPIFNDVYKEYAKQRIDYIPNGVDMGDFIPLPGKTAFPRNGKKAVGYAGVINREADMDLLEYAVSHNTNADFLIVGYATDERLEDIRRLTNEYANFHYLGPKNHKEMSAFMKNCDVLINLKKNDHTTSGGESIKTYEYLATGKPIVSTPVPPADRFTDVMYVTSDKLEFSGFLNKALDENDESLHDRRRSIAANNSWDQRVDVILDKVSQLL